MSGIRRGQWVFVHPEEGAAPRDLRGLAGTVTSIAGERATVTFRRGETDEPVEVAIAILSPERRRRDRPPAQWSNGAVAQSA
jgi:hypothetical protein